MRPVADSVMNKLSGLDALQHEVAALTRIKLRRGRLPGGVARKRGVHRFATRRDGEACNIDADFLEPDEDAIVRKHVIERFYGDHRLESAMRKQIPSATGGTMSRCSAGTSADC
ncbi:hypothetical protein X760_23680 [Mesorhizobium sp. LSHC422A00]|nr:hypothetical protein X760_23680 [Mesorhizobium sp. LSHC422A00]